MQDMHTKNVYSAKQGICCSHGACQFMTTCPKSHNLTLSWSS